MQTHDAEELARARLAYVSAGQRSLSAPRRALEEPAPGPAPPAAPPEPLLDPPSRRRPWTLKHLAVVGVLLLCGVGVALAALGRSSATEVPIAVVSLTPTATAASPAPPAQVRVHVVGAVARPGVVSVPEGAIVQDAVTAAGGLVPDADPALLNLAAPVSDGMQIVIGTRDAPAGGIVATAQPDAGGGGSAAAPLDLNAATQAQLEALPGIGPVTAQAIIAWREEHGRFTAVEELQEITGIGPKTFQKLRDHVTV